MQSPEIQEEIYKLKFNTHGIQVKEIPEDQLIEAYIQMESRRMDLMQDLFTGGQVSMQDQMAMQQKMVEVSCQVADEMFLKYGFDEDDFQQEFTRQNLEQNEKIKRFNQEMMMKVGGGMGGF